MASGEMVSRGNLAHWMETFSGSGYGYGSGDGSGSGYWVSVAASLINAWRTSAATLAFWRSDPAGKPANGGDGGPRQVGMIETSPGPLKLCNPGTLHATLRPEKWKGERLWIVALHGEVAWAEDKLGALKREIIAEVK